MIRIFVYGTLCAGNPNHHFMTSLQNGTAKFVCNGTTKKKYPLVVASSACIPFLINKEGIGEHVFGEVYDIDDDMKSTLDELERVGNWYDCEEIEILTLPNNNVEICPTYMLNKPQKSLLGLPMLKRYAEEHVRMYVPQDKRILTSSDIIKEVKEL